MFQVGYGYRLKGLNDPFFENARQTIHNFTEAAMFTSEFGVTEIDSNPRRAYNTQISYF
jgi:hypothetical protein